MATKIRFQRRTFALALTHGAGVTTASLAATLNGLLKQVIIKTPATVDGSATATINVLDSDSNIIYTKAAVAANTTSNNLLTGDLSVPLCGTQTVQVVFSANQTTTDSTTNVVLLVDMG